MPSSLSSSQSTRLENLHLGPHGAAFDLDGRSVHLNAESYAAPVASMQEFYQQALSDYYMRSAEMHRLAAARKPPLLGRVLSWVGRCISRFLPGPASFAPSRPAPILAPPPREPAGPATPRNPEPAAAPKASTLRSPAVPKIVEPRMEPAEDPTRPSPAAPEGALRPTAKTDAATPLLHVVFADQEGVHVIWQLAAGRREPAGKSPHAAGSKAASPRIELTYSLDSSVARSLQDCYGQLAQLGYKIAGLETVRPTPEKRTTEKETAPSSPVVPAAGPKAPSPEKPGAETVKAAEPKPAPRRPRPEPGPARTEPVPTPAEPLARDPGLLPGI